MEQCIRQKIMCLIQISVSSTNNENFPLDSQITMHKKSSSLFESRDKQSQFSLELLAIYIIYYKSTITTEEMPYDYFFIVTILFTNSVFVHLSTKKLKISKLGACMVL